MTGAEAGLAGKRVLVVEVVAPIAGPCPGHLLEMPQHIAEQEGAQRRNAVQLLAERIGVHPQRGARHLHQDLKAVAVITEQDGQPDHALGAYEADLGAVAVLHGGQPGTVASLDEVDAAHRLLRRMQGLAQCEFDRLQPRPKPGKILGRQGREQPVARSGGGLIEKGHARLLRRSVGESTGLSRPPAPDSHNG
jgi:hypothetical protein